MSSIAGLLTTIISACTDNAILLFIGLLVIVYAFFMGIFVHVEQMRIERNRHREQEQAEKKRHEEVLRKYDSVDKAVEHIYSAPSKSDNFIEQEKEICTVSVIVLVNGFIEQEVKDSYMNNSSK